MHCVHHLVYAPNWATINAEQSSNQQHNILKRGWINSTRTYERINKKYVIKNIFTSTMKYLNQFISSECLYLCVCSFYIN